MLTAEQWEILQRWGVFNGMNISPTKGADGQYTIKLTEADFGTFQINQARGGSAPVPAGSMQFNITMDSSKSSLSRIFEKMYMSLVSSISFPLRAPSPHEDYFFVQVVTTSWCSLLSNGRCFRKWESLTE